MVRSLLACAGLLALISPSLTAQPKVCVFQEKKDIAGKVSDAAAVADELDARSVQAVAAAGISPRNEDAEAGERGCSWIVTVRREEPPPVSPTYGEAGPGTGGGVTSEMAASMARDIIEFSLRRAGMRKTVARGYSQDASPYTKIAGQIATKIGKEK